MTAFGNETDGIVFRELEPVRVASVMHRGSHAGLSQAYAFIVEWIEQNGYRMSGLARECYIEGVWSGADEKDWLTEIQMPIEKA